LELFGELGTQLLPPRSFVTLCEACSWIEFGVCVTPALWRARMGANDDPAYTQSLLRGTNSPEDMALFRRFLIQMRMRSRVSGFIEDARADELRLYGRSGRSSRVAEIDASELLKPYGYVIGYNALVFNLLEAQLLASAFTHEETPPASNTSSF
jgi:hypothetical protein